VVVAEIATPPRLLSAFSRTHLTNFGFGREIPIWFAEAFVRTYIAQMFYRRKLLLGMVELWGGRMARLDLQKILFLVARRQKTPAFDFVPYRFGCFSFQSYADIRAMSAVGQMRSTEAECAIGEAGWFGRLAEDDQRLLREVKRETGSLTGDSLVQKIYREFPYFAIKSEIAPKLLNAEEMALVELQRPTATAPAWFTLGYEGRSLDAYLELLVRQNISHLVDVRKNAYSMKYGFSKSVLAKCCISLGISYSHEPDLGIESEDRQHLQGLKDYEALFATYEQTTLRSDAARKALDRLLEAQAQWPRMALTCFEKDPRYCHRSRVAAALEESSPARHL